jgi:hypothetical protein
MDFSFIIPGYTAATFTRTQAAAVCDVLKARAGGGCCRAGAAAGGSGALRGRGALLGELLRLRPERAAQAP